MKEVPDPEELISTPEPGTPVAKNDPYSALRFRSFRLFAIGSVIASIGSNAQSVAVGWELYERTHSAMALAWVGLVQALPIMLLALPAGHLADRMDRRRIVMISELVMAATSLGLAAMSYLKGPVEWMYVMLLLGAVARAFTWPASQALTPHLVPKELFGNAVTWKSMGFQVACVTGPALGGLLIGLNKSAMPVYLLDALLTLTFVAFLTTIASPTIVRSIEAASLKTLLAGFSYVRQTKVILAAITLDLFAVLLGGAVALLPVYAKEILHVGPAGLGLMRAAPAVGAFTMALALAHLPPMERAGRALLWAVAGFGVVTIIFGFSQWYWLSLAMLAASGALDNISVVIRHSLVQLATRDEMRGRVSAVNSVFISASNELGAFESGAVASLFQSKVTGAIVSVVSGGIGTIVVVAIATCVWPEIRRLGRLQDGTAKS